MATESIQDIKRRIRSVTSTEHITSAMKLVSAGKLRKAKAIYEKTNANSHYITNTIKEMFNSSQDIPQEYLEGNREVKTTCYIICTWYISNIIIFNICFNIFLFRRFRW